MGDSPSSRGPEYFLNSGELLFSSNSCIVKTILGSCVGVAVYDPHLRIGGLCHYLLPEAGSQAPSTRYGDTALPYLISRFRNAGSEKRHLRTWIVGGALLLEAHEIFFVGDRNAQYAETYLNGLGIRVVQNETRGYRGRKVLFDTGQGRLAIELIPSQALKDLLII